MTAFDSCPGCGYPKFGTGLCAYCQPVLVLDNEPPSAVREPTEGLADDVSAAPAV